MFRRTVYRRLRSLCNRFGYTRYRYILVNVRAERNTVFNSNRRYGHCHGCGFGCGFFRSKIGLMQRSTMQEAVSAHHVGGIVRLTKFILKTSVCIELIGAALLLPAFIRDFGITKGLWYALFHSVSAFCNAGFDLIGIKEPFSSLTSYSSQSFFNFTVMALIIIGGIGFLTWEDINNNKLHFRKYRMQSKVILTVTGILIILPSLYFFFFEYQNLPLGERILTSLFQSVTPRTAGFNTTDLTSFS